MRIYKWNKYGLKITINVEVPKEIQNLKRRYCDLTYSEIKENCIQTFDYLGDFTDLYVDNKLFMYSSLLCYIFHDILDIHWRYWEVQNRKRPNYGRNIQSFN